MERERNTFNRWIAMLLTMAMVFVGMPSLSIMAEETATTSATEDSEQEIIEDSVADVEDGEDETEKGEGGEPSITEDSKQESIEDSVTDVEDGEDGIAEVIDEASTESADQQVKTTSILTPFKNALMGRILNTTLNKTMQSIANTDSVFGSTCKFLVGDGGKGQAALLNGMQQELVEIKSSLAELSSQVASLQLSMDANFDKVITQLLKQNYQTALEPITTIETRYKGFFNRYQELVNKSSVEGISADEAEALADEWESLMEALPAYESISSGSISLAGDMATLNACIADTTSSLSRESYMEATEAMFRFYYPFEHQIVPELTQAYNYAVSVQQMVFVLQKEKMTFEQIQKKKDNISYDTMTNDFLDNQVTQIHNAGFSDFMTETPVEEVDDGDVAPDCIHIQTQIGSDMYNAYRVKANTDGCYYIIPKAVFLLDGTSENSIIVSNNISLETDTKSYDITEQVIFNEKWDTILNPSQNYYSISSPSELGFLDVNAGTDPLAFLINDMGRNGGLKDLAFPDLNNEPSVQGFILNSVEENTYSFEQRPAVNQDSSVQLSQKTTFLKAHSYSYEQPNNAENYDTLTTLELAAGSTYRAYVIYKELSGIENFITLNSVDENNDKLYKPSSCSGFKGTTFTLGDHDILDLSNCAETKIPNATTLVITGAAKIIGNTNNTNKTFSNLNIKMLEGANLTVENLHLVGSDGISPVSVNGSNTQLTVVGDNQFQAVHDGESVINNPKWFNANDYADWTKIVHQIPGLSVKQGASITLNGNSRDNSIAFTGAFGGAGISLEGNLQAENLTLIATGSAVNVKKLDTAYTLSSPSYDDATDSAGINSKYERKTGSGTYKNAGAGIGLMVGANTVSIGMDKFNSYFAPQVSYPTVATVSMGQLTMNNVTLKSTSGDPNSAEDIGLSSQGGELAGGSSITNSSVFLENGSINTGIAISEDTQVKAMNINYNISVETMGDQLMDESSNPASAGDQAATKNNIQIRITGDDGSTDWNDLGTIGNQSGGTQTKILNWIANVGNMTEIELKVNGDDSWYPGKISITTSEGTQDFYSYRWISQNGTTINKTDAAYRVYIKTADDSHAGTDGDVTAQIVGETAEGLMVRTDAVDLGDLTDGNRYGNAFEKGDEKTYYIGTDKYLGTATGLQLKMVSNGTAAADWEVANATVEQINPNYSEADKFELKLPSGNLCLKDGEAGVWGRSTGYTGIFKIELQTKDKKNAGTDSNVYITINGSRGSTEAIKVTSYSDHNNALERGELDTCIVPYDTNGIGEIESITINHDGKNTASGWDLDWARVTECVGITEGASKYFKTDSSTQNFDNTIRTLYPTTENYKGELQNRTVTNAQYNISVTGAIEEGATLEVEKYETTSETYKKFLEKSNGAVYRGVYGLKLVKTDGSDASYDGTLSLSFELKNLKSSRLISIIQRIENAYKSWSVSLSEEGTVSVEIEQLTTFGVLENQEKAAENTSSETGNTNNQGKVTQTSNPKTGDMETNILIYVTIALLSGFVIMFVLVKKRNRKNQK